MTSFLQSIEGAQWFAWLPVAFVGVAAALTWSRRARVVLPLLHALARASVAFASGAEFATTVEAYGALSPVPFGVRVLDGAAQAAAPLVLYCAATVLLEGSRLLRRCVRRPRGHSAKVP